MVHEDSLRRPSEGRLLVIVPTRGRPASAIRLASAFSACTRAQLLFVVDNDDPSFEGYLAVMGEIGAVADLLVVPRGNPGIVAPLNAAVEYALEQYDYSYFGFMGDDHLPRTENWDLEVIKALDFAGTGLCYGNDLLQGENLPTAVFMTADIPAALGYMVPPALHHLWADNYWMDLGNGIGDLEYLPDVIVEHLHPINGKSDWDPTYETANNTNAVHDKAIFERLKVSGSIAADIITIQAIAK